MIEGAEGSFRWPHRHDEVLRDCHDSVLSSAAADERFFLDFLRLALGVAIFLLLQDYQLLFLSITGQFFASNAPLLHQEAFPGNRVCPCTA